MSSVEWVISAIRIHKPFHNSTYRLKGIRTQEVVHELHGFARTVKERLATASSHLHVHSKDNQLPSADCRLLHNSQQRPVLNWQHQRWLLAAAFSHLEIGSALFVSRPTESSRNYTVQGLNRETCSYAVSFSLKL